MHARSLQENFVHGRGQKEDCALEENVLFRLEELMQQKRDRRRVEWWRIGGIESNKKQLGCGLEGFSAR